MPKIIHNIEQRIYDAALELFSDKGYDGVEMKAIAKEVGIAVGTLYNYYPNKRSLFINIFNESWSRTFNRLEPIKDKEDNPVSKIKDSITVIYDDVVNRKGLGSQVFSQQKGFLIEDSDTASELIDIKVKLIEAFTSLIKEASTSESIQLSEAVEIRFLETLLIAMFGSMKQHPDEREDNLDFLYKLIDKYLS